MAKDNPLWGAERIQGELLKVEIKISKRTVQKYMRGVRKSPAAGQNWGTFLKNHASDIWASDFITAYDWLFRQFYVFVILELNSRRVVHVAVTASPTDQWTAQQLWEATPWNQGPKYLIRDRDCKYGPRFATVAAGSSIQELKTPFRTPNANAVCERFMGSLRRECLDHCLIIHQRYLERVVQEYIGYCNHERPHQGIGQQIPEHFGEPRIGRSGIITTRPILGGLYHSYSRQGTLILRDRKSVV